MNDGRFWFSSLARSSPRPMLGRVTVNEPVCMPSGVVVVEWLVHAVDERDVIHAPGQLRKKRADLLAALTVLLELPLGVLRNPP